MDTIDPWKADGLNGPERALCAAHSVLIVTMNHQRYSMETGERLGMGIANEMAVSFVRIALPR